MQRLGDWRCACSSFVQRLRWAEQLHLSLDPVELADEVDGRRGDGALVALCSSMNLRRAWALYRAPHKAHARRKFHELSANHGSQVGEQVSKFFSQLYEVERAAVNADSQARLEARRAGRPLADALSLSRPSG